LWNVLYYISAVRGQPECDFSILGRHTVSSTRMTNNHPRTHIYTHTHVHTHSYLTRLISVCPIDRRYLYKCCNTLQHTSTHCITLQRTATHYITMQGVIDLRYTCSDAFRWVTWHSCVWHDTLRRTTWHWCVWHDTLRRVTWYLCVWHDTFRCVTWHAWTCHHRFRWVTCYLCVWHDTFKGMTSHSCVWHDTFRPKARVHMTSVTWLTYTHSLTHCLSFSCVTRLIFVMPIDLRYCNLRTW